MFLAECPKALASNPDCKLSEIVIPKRGTPPSIELEWINGLKQTFWTEKHTIQTIMDEIEDYQCELDLREMYEPEEEDDEIFQVLQAPQKKDQKPGQQAQTKKGIRGKKIPVQKA